MKHYPPLKHGALEEVLEGIWFVQGSVKMPMLMPMKISRSMTVVAVPGTDTLAVINSMRLSEEGFAELDKLGKVAHVIRIAGFHGRDDGFYRERYGAKIYAVEGQSYSRAMDTKKPEPNYLEPDVWLTEDSELPIPGARLVVLKTSSPPEALVLLDRDGGVLITGDSLQNTPSADQYVNFPAKIVMKKMGFYHPHLVGPAWLQFASPTADDVRSLLDLEFDKVLPGHGMPVLAGAKTKYMPSISGPLKGCHGSGA